MLWIPSFIPPRQLLLATALVLGVACSDDPASVPTAVVLSPGFAQEPTWTQKLPATSPQFGYFPAMVYDAARQQVVLFAGFDLQSNTFSNETWIWDGFTWTQRFPATSPPARNSHAIAYDATRQQVVLFGGSVVGTISADTWVWDGVNWTQKFPATRPSARLHTAMTYDVARQQVVLFGGGPGAPIGFADTWVWDGTNWTQKFPATSPPGRGLHRMAYDIVRGQIVLFGATPDGITFFNDTWVWDGTTWTQKFPATSPPIPRYAYAVAYDAARQQVVLFGGQGPSNTPLYGDTWVWDGTTWTQKFPASSPPGRSTHVMAYDAARSQVVMFGGITGGAFQASDTWVWGMPLAVVQIDIKPGSDPNSLNPKAKGTTAVAILSAADFDAPAEVDRASLTFGRTGDEQSLALCTRSAEDVNADGLLDLVCHFENQKTGFQVGDTEGILKGQTTDGTPIEGRDDVRVVNS